MEKIGLITLSKTFSDIKYAKDFLNGKLRFMPLDYYINLEGDSREDKYEGITSMFQPNFSILKIDGVELDSSSLVGPILVRESKDEMHIFCMSAFYYKDEGKFFETKEEILNEINKPDKTKLLSFGEISVLITNINKFIERIDKVIEEKKIYYKRDFVKYINLKDFHGNIEKPGFVKDLKYKDEVEYRFALKGLVNKPFILDIGDINDIAVIMETDHINRLSIKDKE